MKLQLKVMFFLACQFSIVIAIGQTVVRGPYLQTPTHNSIIVKWRTDQPTDSRVKFGPAMDSLINSIDNSVVTTEHTVKINGLSPFTKYYYSVGNVSTTLSGPDSLHHFKTAPLPGTVQPIRIWGIGDFGKANVGEQQVRDAYLNYSKNKHTDVWIWLGDNAYDTGTDQEYQQKVFDYNYYGNVMKNIPFWPCPGNHDYGSVCPIPCGSDPAGHTGPYFDIIDVPAQGEAGGVPSTYELFYSYDYANVHFISLNSEVGSPISSSNDWTGVNPLSSFNGSPMTTWLEADLQANQLPWVIVYFHQPPYTKGSHDSDALWELYMKAMRENFTPIFEQYNVDLVVCGHSHVYERSFMIKGHTGTSSSFSPSNIINGSSGNDQLGEAYIKDLTIPGGEEGTVYVVAGCSGSHESGADLNHPVMHFSVDDIYGSLVIDVDGNRLDSKFLNSTGQILDQFTMIKMDSVPTLADDKIIATNVSVFPNPFQNNTMIEFNILEKADVSIDLVDLSGKKLANLYTGAKSAGSHKVTINGEEMGLSKGLNMLNLTFNGKQTVKKIIKL